MTAHVSSSAVLAPRMPKAASGLNFLFHSLAVWRQRQHLARLDAHLLDDIGLSAREAATEIKRPLWDVPQTRRR